MIGTLSEMEQNQRGTDHKETVGLMTGAALIGVLLIAMPAAAQTQTAAASTTSSNITTTLNPPPAAQARIIEWDLPSDADMSPGAIVVDTQGHDKNQNRMFFVTRQGLPQARVYRMEFPKSLMKGSARWTAWQLSENSIITGGIRKVRASYDRRYVFVRTVLSLERIDTQNCTYGPSPTCLRTVWLDRVDDPGEFDTSDLAVDDWNRVYSTHAINPLDPTVDSSYLQRLTPSATSSGAASVTRWTVGGGAGFCPGAGSSAPCVSGVAVHPTNHYLVYYSEPTGNNIAELNAATNTIRRWSLNGIPFTAPQTAVREPRQLNVDRWGKVWVVTGSGHLVSLDPYSNQVTRHQMPDQDGADPFGLAPDDDVVGYTVSDEGLNKVGVMFPKGQSIRITPTTPYNVTYATTTIPADCQFAAVQTGTVLPVGKTVMAQVTSKADGTFIEAQLNTCSPSLDPSNCTVNDSQIPLGITPVKGKAEGTFFYAVGRNASLAKDPSGVDVPANRVGFVRFPMKEKVKHPRDDDDENDGKDGDHSWHNSHGHATADDDDDDGIANENDQHTMNERDAQADDQKLNASSIAGGQFVDYPVTTTPASVAVIATTQALDPLAQIGIEVYDPSGLLVANSAPTPGFAVATVPLPVVGTYRVRVRNYGAASVTHTPTLLVREPWQP